jgi:hypothetical protein
MVASKSHPCADANAMLAASGGGRAAVGMGSLSSRIAVEVEALLELRA